MSSMYKLVHMTKTSHQTALANMGPHQLFSFLMQILLLLLL